MYFIIVLWGVVVFCDVWMERWFLELFFVILEWVKVFLLWCGEFMLFFFLNRLYVNMFMLDLIGEYVLVE